MANRWSDAHGKSSPEVVPFTWQPTPLFSNEGQSGMRHRPISAGIQSGVSHCLFIANDREIMRSTPFWRDRRDG